MAGEPVHRQVLDAALYVCAGRRDRTFMLREVVQALPHLNPGTVRTHVASRCCVNSPAHHQTRWPYFKQMGRGRYRVEPPTRTGVTRRTPRRSAASAWQDRVLAAMPSGIDPTLIVESLKRTPTERLERMRAFGRALDEMRGTR